MHEIPSSTIGIIIINIIITTLHIKQRIVAMPSPLSNASQNSIQFCQNLTDSDILNRIKQNYPQSPKKKLQHFQYNNNCNINTTNNTRCGLKNKITKLKNCGRNNPDGIKDRLVPRKFRKSKKTSSEQHKSTKSTNKMGEKSVKQTAEI